MLPVALLHVLLHLFVHRTQFFRHTCGGPRFFKNSYNRTFGNDCKCFPPCVLYVLLKDPATRLGLANVNFPSCSCLMTSANFSGDISFFVFFLEVLFSSQGLFIIKSIPDARIRNFLQTRIVNDDSSPFMFSNNVIDTEMHRNNKW